MRNLGLSRSIDISAYAGQQVYISFRHYDCNDKYYLVIDNINVKNLLNVDATLAKVSLPYYGVLSTDYTLKATIKNNGLNPITSVNINWNDGTTDHAATIPVSNLTIGNEATISHTIPVNYATLVEKTMNVTLNQVNGTVDGSPLDNSLTTKFKTVSQNSPKKVLIEEGTGTWCGWCPRGMIAMEYMDTNYSNDYIGVAVHNNDPMTSTDYDTGADISSFPGMNVDRVILGEDVSQAVMTSHVQERKNLVVPAGLNASGSFVGGNLTFNASATFRTNFSNATFKMAAIVMEDDVVGTGAGYNQVNYYNASATPMGMFNTAGNPVPAANMVYDHVGRILLGGYSGAANSVPTVITDGQVVNYTFTGLIPTTYNANNMKVVLLLLDSSTGEVVNARSFKLTTLGTSNEETNANYLTIYPNPTTDYFKIQANYNVDVKMYDASGKIVLEKKNVTPDTAISTSTLSKGLYFVTLKDKNGEIKNQKLIIK